MWQIAYLKILVIWALGYTPSELDDTRNLTYNEQLTCFFSLCEQHYGLNLMFTLYRQYTYNYLALQILQRYNQNFFDQTHAPSTCRQNAIMGNNALDPSAIPSTSSGLGATPSISAPSTCRQNAIMGNNALDPSAIPSTSSGLGATPSISAPSAFPSSAASFNTLIAPGAASSSTAALYTPVASISGSSKKRKYASGKRHKCPHCDYAASQSGTLNVHLRRTHTNVHENEKKYKCVACKKEYKSASALAKHKRNKHGEEASLLCPHKNCDKKFSTKRGLKIHKTKEHILS